MNESKKQLAANVARDESAVRSSHDGSHARPAHGPSAEDQIRMRAYDLYRERGGRVGGEVMDWLRAEREYLERVPGNGAIAHSETTEAANGNAPDAVKANPPRTTTAGWLTAPKFGSAGSGGAELEPGPERD